jgi:hypothetical protein
MSDVVQGAIIALVGVLIAAIAGWVSQLIVRHAQRAQWLIEKRYLAYSNFYNSWEEAKGWIENGSADSSVDAAFHEMCVCARSIDLLGAAPARSAAWSAVQTLNEFRDGHCSAHALQIEINACLNVLKIDLGIEVSVHL